MGDIWATMRGKCTRVELGNRRYVWYPYLALHLSNAQSISSYYPLLGEKSSEHFVSSNPPKGIPLVPQKFDAQNTDWWR
jgi:hypothetical protein